ncbi:MAG: hypothetical protein JRF54_14355 [Deltaproteobacteria bacterium]|nr:hypothetical protein [Deltaproteobacteria bacterium]
MKRREGSGLDGVLEDDEVSAVLRDSFYGGKTTKRGRAKPKKKKPDHYDVICISLYKEDLRISRSALIRFALDEVEIRDFPRAY